MAKGKKTSAIEEQLLAYAQQHQECLDKLEQKAAIPKEISAAKGSFQEYLQSQQKKSFFGKNKPVVVDLRGKNLSGMDLSNADLTGVIFTGADLTGANLAGANLTNANFANATLTGATLAKAYVEVGTYAGENTANFQGATIANADLRESQLINAKLIGANLMGARLDKADLRFADMTDGNLVEAVMVGAKMNERSRLVNAIMTGCLFFDVENPPHLNLEQQAGQTKAIFNHEQLAVALKAPGSTLPKTHFAEFGIENDTQPSFAPSKPWAERTAPQISSPQKF